MTGYGPKTSASVRLMAAAGLAAICVFLLSLSDARGATFPGSNGRIVFTSDRDGGYEIYSMASDGSDVQQLTDNADSEADIQPALSADGRKIAFASDRYSNWDIFVMDADGSNEVRLTQSGAADTAPAWYPDGQYLAEVRGDGANSEIYRIKAQPGFGYDGETRLTDDSAGSGQADKYPTVTPDGTKVLWERDIGTGGSSNTEIFSMNSLTGGSPTNLTNNPNGDYSRPSVSPDGNRFAWSGFRFGLVEIMTADVSDGGNVSTFTNDPDLPSPGGFSPAYSPDGTKLLFATWYNDGAGGVKSFYSANLDGTGLSRLTPASDTIAGISGEVTSDWGRFTTEVLTVTGSGTGGGSVSVTTTAGTTNSFTSASFLTGTPVTLSATPVTGSAFTGWSGGSCTGTGDCSLTMDGTKSVIATFDVPAPVIITGKPSRSTRSKVATFRFSPGAGAVTTYRCRIDTKPTSACSSPVRYRRLKKGVHVFRVNSTLSGIDGRTTTYRWRVR